MDDVLSFETEDSTSFSLDEANIEDEDAFDLQEFQVYPYAEDEEYLTYCIDKMFEDYVLNPLEGKHSISVGSFASDLLEYLNKVDARQKTIASKIKAGRSEGGTRRERLEKRVRNMTRVLHKFIAALCYKYVEVRPRPHDSRFPFSTGRYQRSSLMYFTEDEVSRKSALEEAKANAFNEEYPFYGMKYVLRYTRFSEIFRNDGDIEKRLNKIQGGITVENVAFSESKSGDRYYYGWYNVELHGWGSREAYKPLQSAIDYALAEVPGIVKVERCD